MIKTFHGCRTTIEVFPTGCHGQLKRLQLTCLTYRGTSVLFFSAAKSATDIIFKTAICRMMASVSQLLLPRKIVLPEKIDELLERESFDDLRHKIQIRDWPVAFDF